VFLLGTKIISLEMKKSQEQQATPQPKTTRTFGRYFPGPNGMTFGPKATPKIYIGTIYKKNKKHTEQQTRNELGL